MDEAYYWHGLHLVPKLGAIRLGQLVGLLGSARAVWEASETTLRQYNLPPALVDSLIKKRREIDLSQEVRLLEKLGCRLIIRSDEDYPPMLATTADAPALLYVRGDYLPTDQRAIAIVGTRKATRYGRDATLHLAQSLAQAGVVIVSGTAEGIDSCAHEGAIKGGGRSLAILGNGIDIVYPQSNRDLIHKVTHHGALMTEFAPGTPPHRSHFPRRNRIISGLSLAVLVVEAPERSGALITATIALEQGRDVFAVPSNMFNPQGYGSNRLIQDGAKLVMGVDDILSELDIVYEHNQTRVRMQDIVPENETEARILEHLGTDPIHIDDIIRLCGLPAYEVSAALSVLELKGVAQMSGSMQYCRVVL